MLESLYVKDFAIVGEAEVGLGPGMVVLTGETGAGKSLLVDALVLLAGGRADAGMIRHGCERAELGARFDLGRLPAARAWLEEQELDEDGGVDLRRVIRAGGNSRAWINGRPATLGQLRDLAAHLVEIHGQHEHQALLERSRQLEILDAFGGHAELLAEVGGLAGRWRAIRAERQALAPGGTDPSARADWLRHQLEELDSQNLDPQAIAALENEHRRLAGGEALLRGVAGVVEQLDGEGELALLPQLARIGAELERLAGMDPALAGPAAGLRGAGIELAEAADDLARYRDALDLDPTRLQQAEDRLARLHDLSRKHRVAAPDLAAHAQHLRAELTQLEGAEARAAALAAEEEAVAQAWRAAAGRLSTARGKAAERLGSEVSALMGELGMAGARFQVELEPRDGDPAAGGQERCEFLVSANPGQPPRPLRRVASGGELSRISLAIEVAALGSDPVGTMVFDEVDSGIGGAVAEVVGHKLRALGERGQVLCVTHLPQVAALGHRHLGVRKEQGTEATATRIEVLDGSGREDEIARMLGGITITAATRVHARQMLAQAG